MLNPNPQPLDKAPHLVLPGVFAFAPNRDTLGGTAYFIVSNSGNILIDAPAWHNTNRNFVNSQGGLHYLIVTHRGGLGQIASIAKELAVSVIIQEQEAYLLPETPTITYQQSFQITDRLCAVWTPGHSPGSACIYYESPHQSTNLARKGLLFTGRHLLPTHETSLEGNQQINPQPLKTAKTFHWPRQQRSVTNLKKLYPQAAYLLPGASTGLLRGQGYIDLQGSTW
jgi:glyoxylase-like metal-dependent hydrolase (beta-lactamase superfamily II)